MKIISIALLLLILQKAVAQKKLIDNYSYKSWVSLRSYGISSDGKYVWYNYGSHETGNSLVIVSSDGKTRKEVVGADGATFTADSRFIIFNHPNGIGVLDVQRDIQIIEGSSFQIPCKGKGQWMTYRAGVNLLLRNLHSEEEHRYEKVNECWFNEDGSVLILKKDSGLTWIALPAKKEQHLYHGKAPRNIAFDKSGKQVAFIAEMKGEQQLCYYRIGMDSAIILATPHSTGIGEGLVIKNITPAFSPDGKMVFFYLSIPARDPFKKKDIKSDVITEGVDIWSYRDRYLQSQQLEAPSTVKKELFWAVISVGGGNVLQLEDDIIELSGNCIQNNQYILAHDITNEPEAYWDSTQVVKYYLLSLRNDGRKQLLPVKGEVSEVMLSPTERFITWCDRSSCYSYDIMTGLTTDLTAQIPYRLPMEGLHRETLPFNIGGWLSSDNAILLYDRYDIWQVDPLGKKKTINITGSYGRDNKTVLRIALESDLSAKEQDSLLLTGLEDRTGDNGFFKAILSRGDIPRKCEMGPYLYYFPDIFVFGPPPPIKATAAEVYVLKKQSADMAPNLILTHDFRTFTVLSDIAPQREYNWMTAERVLWTASDGKQRAGILYKPEDFDEGKKYPVIFTYYELRSNELHQFRPPLLSTDNLNIPWYVSHGYLVFIPDIWPMKGHPGKSALISVESATTYLTSMYPWIDKDKLGLQGHSFGGYETNYIITHSNRFVAAQSAAGVADLVSFYGQIAFGGKSLVPLCERGQINLGVSLWEESSVYLENSPLMQANKVITPLLLMHNNNDGAVPFSQSLEFFNALRRLKKKVWLLQYEKGGHTLFPDTPEAFDFTIRVEQFFDYYLKGAFPPAWMIEGIPCFNKGIISGLQLDNSGSKIP